jgi:hypothetical protein
MCGEHEKYMDHTYTRIKMHSRVRGECRVRQNKGHTYLCVKEILEIFIDVGCPEIGVLHEAHAEELALFLSPREQPAHLYPVCMYVYM